MKQHKSINSVYLWRDADRRLPRSSQASSPVIDSNKVDDKDQYPQFPSDSHMHTMAYTQLHTSVSMLMQTCIHTQSQIQGWLHSAENTRTLKQEVHSSL